MADHISPPVASANDHPTPQVRPRSRWRFVLGIVISVVILVLALLNRAWIIEALGLAREAKPIGLVAAFALIMLGFLISSQVFQVVARSLGYQLGVLRLWGTAIVAIVTSQSFPAGSVGSYAFLLHSFRRYGISSGQAALIAMLEALSYAGAMVLFSIFGLAYLAAHVFAAGSDSESLLAPLLAVVVIVLVIGAVVFVLTRGEAKLTSWLVKLSRLTARVLRREHDDAWVSHTIAELARGRVLVAEQRSTIIKLVAIQLAALTCHSLALYTILASLSVQVNFLAVIAAFGIALLTSTVNVLPGGGGTVEAALVAVLAEFGVGALAVPAAIVFRLLNFWFMLPVAASCYAWLMRDRRGQASGAGDQEDTADER